MKENELPSLEKLCHDTRVALPFALLFCPDQAKQVVEINQKVCAMRKQIELFCERFSDRGWCVYDSMKLSVIEEANKIYDEKGIDAAEQILITFYKGEAKEVTHWIKNSDKAFMVRCNLLQHFFEQHFAERYYSSKYPYIMAVVEMLQTWKSKNYGSLGEKLSLLFSEHSTAGKRAGACRSLFSNKCFQSFRLISVKEVGCCMSEVEVQVE